jgi:Rrf2 family protein
MVAKVMQQLGHKGILKSEQGAHGGYLVQCDLSKHSFFDLVQMIEGPVGVVKCLQGHESSSCELFSNCNIVSPLNFLNERLMQFYRDLTLADLLKANRKIRPAPTQQAVPS